MDFTTIEHLQLAVSATYGAVIKYDDKVFVTDITWRGGFTAMVFEFIETPEETGLGDIECRLAPWAEAKETFKDNGHVATALIPLGAVLEGESTIDALDKRVEISSVNGGKNFVSNPDAIEQFGWIWKTNTWDDVTKPENLLRKAKEWLTTTQFETLTLRLSAADLSELGQEYDAFAEGDRVHCLAAPYGMDIVLPIMKLSIPLQNPAGRTLELSNQRQLSYTSQQTATQTQLVQKTEQQTATNKNIQLSIDTLSALVTGNNGGYKLTEVDSAGRWLRDLYMDTPDKTTAKRILQINKDGISASTNGYAGPYTVGITIDGQILGSWIAANSIDTNHLSIGLNAWIKGTQDGLESKVEKDGIISTINQSSEEVSINASRLNLNGAITANGNVKIDTDGTLTANNARLAGSICTFTSFDEDYEDPFVHVADRGIAFRKGNALIGMVSNHATYSDQYGNGISISTPGLREDQDNNAVHLITCDLYLIAQNLYTKTGEYGDTVYQGRTGNFALDGYHNYRFVNGLLVDVT